MKNKRVILSLVLMLFVVSFVVAEINAVTPSTNDDNRVNGWAHVNEVSVDAGEVTLEFVQPRAFYACFEYRTDGDTTQKTSDTNYNADITDGLYPFYCLNNEAQTEIITANEYVEVRMVFGAERDERFDWTRFDVLPMSTKTVPIMDKSLFILLVMVVLALGLYGLKEYGKQ